MSDEPIVLPNSREAEEGLLGAILVDPTQYPKVMSMLTVQSFYQDINGWIWAAFRDLSEAGRAIDLLTVYETLDKKGQAQEVGGFGYFAKLMDNVPTSLHAKAYAEVVADKYARRKVIAIAGQIAKDAFDKNKPLKVSDHYDSIRQISFEVCPDEAIPDQVDTALDFAEHITQDRLCIPTGISNLDYLLGGIEYRKHMVIAAPTGRGKTALAYQIAQNMSLSGHLVLYFLLEMDRVSLMARRVCGLEKIPYRDVIAKRVQPTDIERLQKAAMDYAEKLGNKLMVYDSPKTTTDIMYQLVYKFRPDAIITDHLRLVKNKGENEYLRLGHITETIHDMCKEYNMGGISLSQMNRYGQRQMQEDSDREPELSDLRDSGQIEENADTVLFIHWQPKKATTLEAYNPKVNCDILAKKFRSGASDMRAEMVFDRSIQWFDPRNTFERKITQPIPQVMRPDPREPVRTNWMDKED